MIKKSILKWILGIVLVIAYAGFFAWQQINGLGALPVVIITLGWLWLFKKATGINLDIFSEEKEK